MNKNKTISEQQALSTLITVSDITTILLKTDDINCTIPNVLRILGEAVKVSRVYIYQNQPQTENDITTRQIFEWVDTKSHVKVDKVPVKNVPMIASGYKRWVEQLSQKNVVSGLVSDFPKSEQDMLHAQKIISICVAPILTDDFFWGFIGFDDCVNSREWSTIEIEVLRVASNILATYFKLYSSNISLKEGEKYFRNIFDKTTIGMYHSSLDGKILMANPALVKKLGYDTFDELSHANLNDEDRKQEYDRQTFLDKIVNDGYINGFETVWTKRDGTKIYIRESAQAIKDDEGNILYFEGTIEDITEQKQTEKALLESKELLKEAQKIGKLGNWEFDLATNEIKWSEEVYFIFNRDIKQGPPKHIDEIYNVLLPDSQSKMKNAINTTLKKRERSSAELLMKVDGGKIKNLFGVISPIVVDGEVVKLHGVIQDISDIKMTEEQLIKSQKLESVGILAGGIAHDFNNLLTGILGNIALAKLELDSEHEAFICLDEAENATMSAKELTKQILTFSTGGKPVLKPTKLDDLIIRSINLIVKSGNINPIYQIPTDLFPVEVDQGLFRQVLYNLVVNSEQAMPNGGLLKVSAENCILQEGEILTLEKGNYIKISIVDEGVGIPQRNISKVFDPYYTTKQSGSGLGLATAFSIIKKHKGYINIDSVLGEGTTVTFYLPAYTKDLPIDETGEGLKEKTTDTQSKGRILLMDDEDFIRNLAIRVLTRAGFEVEAVEDGEQALMTYETNLINNKKFDVVILDLTVPAGMGGQETIGRLKKFDPEVKSIVCSGYSNDPVMSFYSQYGFDSVVAKPYSPADLVNAVNELLGY